MFTPETATRLLPNRWPQVLEAIDEGTAGATGDAFFNRLVQHLASALGVNCALVGSLADGDRVAVRAFWRDDGLAEPFTYDLEGTPCESVMGQTLKLYPSGVKQLFPDDEQLAALGAESYLGSPLFSSAGDALGILAVLDSRPMDDDESLKRIFRIFAGRAGAELERLRSEQALKTSLARFKSYVERSLDAVIVVDGEGRIVECNPAASRLLELPDSVLRKRNIFEFMPGDPDQRQAFIDHFERVRDAGTSIGEVALRRPSGRLAWTEINASALGRDRYLGVIRDVTDRKEADARLAYLAHHDAKTGLANRTLLMERVAQAMRRVKRHGGGFALLCVDLGSFRLVSETLGLGAAEVLLMAAAERFRAIVREGDTVARLDGDEFVLLLEDCTRSEAAAIVAAKVLHQLGQPVHTVGRELYQTPSIGIGLYPGDAVDPPTLLANAEAAADRAREQGRNTCQFYKAEINARALERLTMETALRAAIAHDELFLCYQPIVDVETLAVTGAEALVRWRHPDLGVLAPSRFIPLAEETGLILPLGRSVLEGACHQGQAWRAAGGRPMKIAVNLSARQFQDPELPDHVASVLARSGLKPQSLELELTETAVMTDLDHASVTLRRLSALGVSLAIDDFGTGHSSLAYLKRLPIDTLKIDRSFVRDAATDHDSHAIVATIVAMAHILRLSVVAEGVEDEAQLALLRELRCDRAQGFLFHGPLPPEAFAPLASVDRAAPRRTAVG